MRRSSLQSQSQAKSILLDVSDKIKYVSPAQVVLMCYQPFTYHQVSFTCYWHRYLLHVTSTCHSYVSPEKVSLICHQHRCLLCVTSILHITGTGASYVSPAWVPLMCYKTFTYHRHRCISQCHRHWSQLQFHLA